MVRTGGAGTVSSRCDAGATVREFAYWQAAHGGSLNQPGHPAIEGAPVGDKVEQPGKTVADSNNGGHHQGGQHQFFTQGITLLGNPDTADSFGGLTAFCGRQCSLYRRDRQPGWDSPGPEPGGNHLGLFEL